jgi:hypothetical protein
MLHVNHLAEEVCEKTMVTSQGLALWMENQHEAGHMNRVLLSLAKTFLSTLQPQISY